MARRNRDPEREAKREKMSSLLQELKVSSMEDIHDLFKEMIGTFLFFAIAKCNKTQRKV